jgi:hypothetical protein
MRIDLSELERTEGRRLSVSDVLTLMCELNLGGWAPAIEQDCDRIYIRISNRWAL